MGTRSAIFKEQKDGTFQGIYCHWDGYIEGVGTVLYEHYQEPRKTQRLINQKKALSSLGVKGKVLCEYDYPQYCKLTYCGWHEYCLYCSDESEQYIANSLDEIKNFEYLTLTEDGKIDGYEKEVAGRKVFFPFRGSDNNGFIYVQRYSGEWLVSVRNSTGEMKAFQPLSHYITKEETKKELNC